MIIVCPSYLSSGVDVVLKYPSNTTSLQYIQAEETVGIQLIVASFPSCSWIVVEVSYNVNHIFWFLLRQIELLDKPASCECRSCLMWDSRCAYQLPCLSVQRTRHDPVKMIVVGVHVCTLELPNAAFAPGSENPALG